LSTYWYYKINRELRDYHASIQVKPGLAVLALFVPIAGWVSIYNTGTRIGQAQQLAGLGSQCSGVLGLVASWFFGLHTIYFQGQLNRVWNGR
jgi:ABC-type proline/glycine betaine transport system permease subunit